MKEPPGELMYMVISESGIPGTSSCAMTSSAPGVHLHGLGTRWSSNSFVQGFWR